MHNVEGITSNVSSWMHFRLKFASLDIWDVLAIAASLGIYRLKYGRDPRETHDIHKMFLRYLLTESSHLPGSKPVVNLCQLVVRFFTCYITVSRHSYMSILTYTCICINRVVTPAGLKDVE